MKSKSNNKQKYESQDDRNRKPIKERENIDKEKKEEKWISGLMER